MWRGCVVFLVLFLAACTGSNELERDYQIVLGLSNQPSLTGMLSNCKGTLGTTGGLLRIDSRELARKLNGSNPQTQGQCNFIPTDSPPFDIERSFNSAALGSLFVSQPKPSQTQTTGRVQAFSSILTELWRYPSATVPLPATQTEFCPTQLVLSSGETPSNNAPSESLLFVLDDPTDPQTGCTADREVRVTALNRDGTRKGWLGLGIANRSLGQVRLAASSSELFILYADTGTAYRVARLLFTSLVDNTPSSSLQISEPIPGVFSSANTALALAFTASNTGISLVVGVGGSSGTVLPVSFNTTTNRPEFGAALRETTETSELIGATNAIFWNRDAGQKPLSIFARERPDIVLRRVQGGIAQRQTRVLTTTDGVFTPDGFFWGLHNSTLYRLDVFNFPNLQLTQNPSPLSDAAITSINWVVCGQLTCVP
jgi:hypothetical protein